MYFILFEVTEMLLLYIIVKKNERPFKTGVGCHNGLYIMDHKESQK